MNLTVKQVYILMMSKRIDRDYKTLTHNNGEQIIYNLKVRISPWSPALINRIYNKFVYVTYINHMNVACIDTSIISLPSRLNDG